MRSLLVSAIILLCFYVSSQQVPHMSQWASHQMAINPAHTGIKTCLEAQGTLRGQWVNINGAPATGWVTVSAPLKAKRNEFLSARHGLGAMVNYDQLGPFTQITAMMSYAGHFNFSQDERLSLGLALGGTQLAFNMNKATPLLPDPVINGSAVELKPAATFGAWWNGLNYFAGLSLYQLIPQKWTKIGMSAKSSMHGMINGGFRAQLSKDWTVLPGLYVGFVKSAPIDLQIQALFDYKGRFITGLGLRNKDAVIGFLGFRFEDRWRVMYSYDFVLSQLRPGTMGSHELTIGFSPCRTPSSDQQLCPLFE